MRHFVIHNPNSIKKLHTCSRTHLLNHRFYTFRAYDKNQHFFHPFDSFMVFWYNFIAVHNVVCSCNREFSHTFLSASSLFLLQFLNCTEFIAFTYHFLSLSINSTISILKMCNERNEHWVPTTICTLHMPWASQHSGFVI